MLYSKYSGSRGSKFYGGNVGHLSSSDTLLYGSHGELSFSAASEYLCNTTLSERQFPQYTGIFTALFCIYSALCTLHAVLFWMFPCASAHPPPKGVAFWKTAETSAKNRPFHTLFCGWVFAFKVPLCEAGRDLGRG